MEPPKNNTFLKKIFLLTASCVFLLNVTAQISVKVEKKYIGQYVVIYTTLTNTSGYPIHVVDGSLMGDDGGIESSGNTNIVFSSYDINNNLLETSDMIPFTLSDPGNRKPVIKFATGQSCLSQRLLFTANGFYGIFDKAMNAGIRYFKAKIHVKYCRPGIDDSFKELDIDVSQILI